MKEICCLDLKCSVMFYFTAFCKICTIFLKQSSEGVLKNFAKFTGKHLSQRFFFSKVADLRSPSLLKKRPWHRCFPVNFVKFLRTPFYIEHLWWLLLHRPCNLTRYLYLEQYFPLQIEKTVSVVFLALFQEIKMFFFKKCALFGFPKKILYEKIIGPAFFIVHILRCTNYEKSRFLL